MKKNIFLIVLVIQSTTLVAQDLTQYFNSVKYRNIGPFRGGRSVTASGVVGDPLTYYMGTTGGGLWKTTNAGQHWNNISDEYFTTGSVGAVAVSASDPNVIYCGMGEHAPRAVMTSYGDGIYKSTDAGKTWSKIGLAKTQHIARIVIHPKDPNIVFVAAQGALYGPNEERGIFKTEDGGETWSKVLFVNQLTGCAELSMDFNNPQVLYAAMWEHQRKPWKVISGGTGSGLYKSTDGGKSWKIIHNGLPKEMGKMAIAVSKTNSEKVYALIESDSNKEQGGLFVSNNAGKSWSKISSDHRLIQRAWYYIELFIDPNDEETVYVLSAPALRSIDGGKTWERLSGTHGDYHDLWINPDDSKNLVIANDGGAAISYDYGVTWSTQANMPTSQFYRVNVDNLWPYNIYGGQQDNSSIKISSIGLASYNIDEHHWSPSAGGESAFLAFDPDNPRYVLGGSYLGTISVLDTKSGSETNIMAAPIQYLARDAKDMKYRFNWNAPIIWSAHEPNTYYHGAQYLLKTSDMGVNWEEVSPDLTRNQKEKQGKGGGPFTNEAVGAENYGTLSYVVESPHEKGVIWTGSDDGLVQLTRDGGQNWSNVTPKKLQECLVNAIEVSPHDRATVFIATTRYKFNDYTPALYKSSDYGKSWTNISQGIPDGAYTRVVRQDPVKQNILYAGTETGIYISWNGGNSWESFNLNLPVVPITDLIVKNENLIVATAGRSFWVLDDLGLIRQYNKNDHTIKLFVPGKTYISNWGSSMNENPLTSDGTHSLKGVNPASDMVIYYNLADTTSLTLEIRDQKGVLVNSFSSKKNSDHISYAGGPSADPILPNKKGLNRFVWNKRYSTMPGIPTAYIEGSYQGHVVSPGTYDLVLSIGELEKKQSVEVLSHPLYEVSPEQYEVYHEFMLEAEANFTAMHEKVNLILKMRKQLQGVIEKIPSEKNELIKKARDLIKKMKAWDELMVQRKSKAYDDVENFPNKFTAEYIFMINQTESAIPKVNQASIDRKAELDEQWAELNKTAMEIINEDIPAMNQGLWDAGVGALNEEE